MARNNKTSETLFQFMNHLITLLHQNGQHRTMQHYKATLNSFKRYRANRDIALRDLSAEEMRSYEAHLKNVSKVCSNTISFYLRTLRATYNKAVEQRLTPQKHPSETSTQASPKPGSGPSPQPPSARSNIWLSLKISHIIRNLQETPSSCASICEASPSSTLPTSASPTSAKAISITPEARPANALPSVGRRRCSSC